LRVAVVVSGLNNKKNPIVQNKPSGYRRVSSC